VTTPTHFGRTRGPVGAIAAAATAAALIIGPGGPVDAVAPTVQPSAAAADAGRPLVISEFRLRGPAGATDEFIEITNVSSSDHLVSAVSGAGYAVAASDGAIRCTIPNGTTIPSFGSYLCANSVGYSLTASAAPEATYTTDIPDNTGIALFDNDTGGGSFTLASRLDAVGSTSEPNALYKEGTGYPALAPLGLEYSFYRNLSTSSTGSATLTTATPGLPEDTDDNATDFVFVDTSGNSSGAGSRLGAPGPSNLASPRPNGRLVLSPLDPCVSNGSPPNSVRDFTSDAPNNSTLGTVDFRRTITNNTGGVVTGLRLRIADIRTLPAPPGTADLRVRSSGSVVITVDRDPCGAGTINVVAQGTTLQPPAQLLGGGFNSTLSVPTVTPGTPLAPGASVDVRLLFGLQQVGPASVRVIVEAITNGEDGIVDEGTCLTGGALPSACQVCGGLEPTIVGTTGGNTITGTSGQDVILALGGDDTITGVGGDDVICAGAGSDTIDAGDDADIIRGGAGDDTVTGGAGGDRVLGGTGDDTSLSGGDGDDRVVGGGGADMINGDAGNDHLHGGADDDTINGGDDDDRLVGGAGTDTLDGGGGVNVLIQ
jgi:Ca2+-binding RTX toxin-like protein